MRKNCKLKMMNKDSERKGNLNMIPKINIFNLNLPGIFCFKGEIYTRYYS